MLLQYPPFNMATRKKGMIFSDRKLSRGKINDETLHTNLRQHLVSTNQFYQNSYCNMFDHNINNKLCLPVFVYLRNKKTTTTTTTTKVNPPAAALPTIIGNCSLDSEKKKKYYTLKRTEHST